MSDSTVAQLLQQALGAEHRGLFAEARSLLEQAVEQAGATARGHEARLRLAKLQIQGGPGLYNQAETTLNVARQHSRQMGWPLQEASAIHLLALLERHRGGLDRAWQLLGQSPVLHSCDAPGQELGQCLHYRALVAADRGDLANAERLLFRAHALYAELDCAAGLAEVCDSLANVLLNRGKSRPALALAQQSLELKRRLGDRYGEAVSLGTIGRTYMLQARYAEASDAFAQDLALAEQVGDQKGIGIMLNSLAEACHRVGGLEQAYGYYLRNLEVDRGPVNTMFAYVGLSRVHLTAGRWDEAEKLCKQLAELLAQYPHPRGLQHALDGLRGSLAWRRGDDQRGEQLLKTAAAALQDRPTGLDAIPLLYELRDLYQHTGRTAEAVATMGRALQLLSECGAERGVLDVEIWLRTADAPALARLSLTRHFPDYLVEGILSGQLAAQPAREQEITVLFTDIREYTTLSEGLEPCAVVELLNEWFAEVTRAIRRFGGVVDKFMGDAVMVLFGVPQGRDDAPADAVRAALELRDALTALNLRHRVLGQPQLRIGCGIHTGKVVVGFIGSHLRQSYTAIGDVVNIGSRLESATKQYPGCDILISHEVEDCQHRFGAAETQFLGMLELKGRLEPTAVYQVRGRRHAAAPVPEPRP
jgi:class 3 adenylate cyclase